LIAAAALTSCGGGVGEAALVVPFFTFGFSGNVGGVQYEVFFLPDMPTSSSGNFDTVNINVDATQFQYIGSSYSGCEFSISGATKTVPPPAAASYSGRFTSKDVIELTSTAPALGVEEVLTLTRSNGGTDLRPTTC